MEQKLRLSALALAVTLTLSACATTSGGGASASSSDGECNPWITGAVGAVIGGVLAGGKNTAKGAAAGAAIGALGCLAINAHSRQVKDAQVVERDYRSVNAGQLPAQPQVLTYQTQVEPGRAVPAGENVTISSNIAVVAGQKQPITEVKEELVLVDTAGKEFRRSSKVVSENGSGQYENTFNFKFPKGVSQGVYGVKTALYVNGEKARESSNRVQLVVSEEGLMHLAALD
ncbi:hypothetical protein GPA19_14525 [Azoarcus indigens]|uniref:Outer membrane protein with glycine zipper n=1 Tax=Azoarcus indigens TaxID=29545 RepID=A0A4R6DLH0_9RHOO|nr:hypothetical protein [Azoarcus indigens]NMG66164.1 hypothetical protein [Azoarcus indigens]TDN45583.1 hypothetical protein C7389_12937 [Azoarcus indigens]